MMAAREINRARNGRVLVQGSLSSPHHVFGDAGLADLDAELKQLAMDPRRSPQRVGDAHLADQPSYFDRHRRSAGTRSRLPAPVRSDPGQMPPDDSLRL